VFLLINYYTNVAMVIIDKLSWRDGTQLVNELNAHRQKLYYWFKSNYFDVYKLATLCEVY
jgi:hypothetical protein